MVKYFHTCICVYYVTNIVQDTTSLIFTKLLIALSAIIFTKIIFNDKCKYLVTHLRLANADDNVSKLVTLYLTEATELLCCLYFGLC